MTLPVYRLRRLLAATAILLTMVVAGMYFYARSRADNALKSIPGKIGIDIKQTAKGFQISKSDGKRTLFTVEASDVKQFKLNGNAELHNVNIVLYGRDSSRFDQIYGDDFAYDQKTGNVTAKGDVQIDLVANPAGLTSPDQSTPKELKNPIHLRTRDLVFNKDSGNAFTDARVDFRTPQARGWAVGVKYAGKTNVLTLSSQIHLELSGAETSVIEAEHGSITNDPRQIVLDHPRLDRQDASLQADEATFYLDSENHVERVLANGNVTTYTRTQPSKRSGSLGQSKGSGDQPAEMHGHSDDAEFLFIPGEDLLHSAVLKGHVHVEQSGSQVIQGDAGRVILDFAGQNQLQKVHAMDGSRIVQKSPGGKVMDAASASAPQDFELTAPAIDFTIEQAKVLSRAATSGAAQIIIMQAGSTAAGSSPQRTVVTAGRFDARFSESGGRNHLASIHGAPNARVVNSAPGTPDRISTSDSIDAAFLDQGGIDSIKQAGKVAYSDDEGPGKQVRAWADLANYTPSDQLLILTGNPRVENGGMATTARTIRINRGTGEATAETEVKTSYSELKEQPDGALLGSASPIHVTARTMTAQSDSGVALYTGNVRLWQDANVLEAPSIQFDRNRRFVTAQGTRTHPVQTILVQTEKTSPSPEVKNGKPKSSLSASSSLVTITSEKLTYADLERKVHYEGGVVARGTEFTASSKTMDAYLLSRSQTSANQSIAGPGQLDRILAEGNVLVQQLNRRADGQKLVYTAAEDMFVLTGGPPSIFDAEQGKITGVSLTFFRRDDRVLVEGEAKVPVVTQTRVAR